MKCIGCLKPWEMCAYKVITLLFGQVGNISTVIIPVLNIANLRSTSQIITVLMSFTQSDYCHECFELISVQATYSY